MIRRNANFARSYRQNAIQTASRGQLTLMFFDGALRFLRKGVESFEIEDYSRRNEAVNNNLVRAQEIIAELQRTLDHSVGGEFASTMDRLYDYMYRELQKANIEKSVEPVHNVIRFLTDIRDAWSEMLQNGQPALIAS